MNIDKSKYPTEEIFFIFTRRRFGFHQKLDSRDASQKSITGDGCLLFFNH
jgi:hypothetical protein